MFYDAKDLGRAISVAFIGPSVTPYYDLNPGYRIYYVDGDHDKSTRVTDYLHPHDVVPLGYNLICNITKHGACHILVVALLREEYKS